MENCYVCGDPLTVIKDQPYNYNECGLDVVLLGITQYHCEKCGEDFAAIPSPQKLHRIIGFHICTENKALLRPKEIMFLRKELRLKAKDLARILGVSDSIVSRWENEKAPIGEGNDRLLRSIFLSSINEIVGIRECPPTILDLFKELPQKRKEIKKPHAISLNPQEWMQVENCCTA
ncbi:MAG: type II toxin-antitoxin system MqsA family antitoxin [Desulfocapsaceae bacterium]|nr:type II toxin-antitoxin system MqsA family antitoxin [Desulfocapsaceae bacterium]